MNTLSNELVAFRAVPDSQRIKVEAGALREEVSQKSQYRTIATTAASMLAWFADNMPISFEERKNIDEVLFSLQNAPTQNKTERADTASRLIGLLSHYTK